MKTPISMGPCNQHMLVTCEAIDFALLRDKSSNFGIPSSDEVREENRSMRRSACGNGGSGNSAMYEKLASVWIRGNQPGATCWPSTCEPTVRLPSATLGAYRQYVAEKISDHVPLAVDLDFVR
jgi:uncharacterized protein (DUF2235 family)